MHKKERSVKKTQLLQREKRGGSVSTLPVWVYLFHLTAVQMQLMVSRKHRAVCVIE